MTPGHKKEADRIVSWIHRFLYFSAALAAAAVMAVLLWGARGNHASHDVIADVTVNLGGRPVREHCTTCHILGGLPETGNPHPDISPHSWTTLGCTGCHLGEGMALDRTFSHGLPGHGAREVLAGKDLQARCYACHELAPLPGGEKAWRGYELFVENACGTCHTLSRNTPGGWYGPDLSEIGSTLGVDALMEAIREPRKEPLNSIMPRFALSSGQARKLTWFLKSRVRDPLYATPMELEAGRVRLPQLVPPIPEGLPSQGRLLAEKQCLGCHKFGEADGRIAPDLTWIGSMQDRKYLDGFLANPARLIPGATMPPVPMAPEEQAKLVRFLAEEAKGPVPLEHLGGGGHFSFDSQPQRDGGGEAKSLYMQLCQRCHAAAGDGFGLIQPDLANFPRAFVDNEAFFLRIDSERLHQSVTKGIAGTSMPPYEGLLAKEQVEKVLDLIFASFVGIPPGEKADLPPLPRRPEARLDRKAAESLFSDLCVRCHGRSGTGKGPESQNLLPRPRNLTNRPYFASLGDERLVRAIADGIPGTAMPAFRHRLNAREIWSLMEKVRQFSGEHDERIAEPRAPIMAP